MAMDVDQVDPSRLLLYCSQPAELGPIMCLHSANHLHSPPIYNHQLRRQVYQQIVFQLQSSGANSFFAGRY